MFYGGILWKDKGEVVKGKFWFIDLKGFSKLLFYLFN